MVYIKIQQKKEAKEKEWTTKEELFEAFDLALKVQQKNVEKNGAYTVAFVGGGGKTSSIYELAREAKKREKTSIIVTTTHMLAPASGGIVLREDDKMRLDFKKVRQQLKENCFVVVGRQAKHGKITFVGEENYKKLRQMAHFIFVEADGSRHFPLKVPAAHEPVILPDVDEIVCICGLSCYGKIAKDACFRLEEAQALLTENLKYETLIEKSEIFGNDGNVTKELSKQLFEKETEKIYAHGKWTIGQKEIGCLMQHGYLTPLREKYVDATVSMMLTQADTKKLEQVGRQLFESMGECGVMASGIPLRT